MSATRKIRKRETFGLMHYLDKRLGSHAGIGPEYQFYCPFASTGSEASRAVASSGSTMLR